jgi:hypothetical protein
MTAKRAAATQGSRERDENASDDPLMAMRESRNQSQTEPNSYVSASRTTITQAQPPPCTAEEPQKSVVSAVPVSEPTDDSIASIRETDAQRREAR